MAYVIAEPCVDVMDRARVDECPEDCIYLEDNGRGAGIPYSSPMWR